MHVLVIGKTGQVARALARTLPNTFTARFVDRNTLDLSWGAPQLKAAMLPLLNADIVMNAAAFTDVNGAEKHADTAFLVNGQAVDVMARLCAARDIPLIHISTDYVFDGQKHSPYSPADLPNPMNVYGASKLAGEQAMRAASVRGAIVRTSWVFDGYSQNFFTNIMNKALINPGFEIVSDQIGRPTHARALAQALWTIANATVSGLKTYHVCGGGPPIGWDDFARRFLERGFAQDYQQDWVRSKITVHAPGIAMRPPHTILDTSVFENAFAYALPRWHDGVDLAIKEWRLARRDG